MSYPNNYGRSVINLAVSEQLFIPQGVNLTSPNAFPVAKEGNISFGLDTNTLYLGYSGIWHPIGQAGSTGPSITGPTGLGATGRTGSTGLGETGNTGMTGPSITGSTGLGATGNTGSTGITGPSITGSTGLGATGNTGM